MKKKIFSIVAAIALIATLTVCLIGCIPSDPAKAVSNLEEAGYTASTTGLGIVEGGDVLVKAADKNGNFIAIMYFKDKASAKKLHDEFKDDLNKIFSFLNINESKEKLTLAIKGKLIYCGTAAAIKAAG